MGYNLDIIDISVLVLYFVFIVWFGIKSSKKGSESTSDYFLAGRNMTWPIIGFSLFAASISSTTLIGKSGDAYSTGIAVFNYDLISVLVMVFFAMFFLPFYIKSGIFTIPEFLEKRFDKRSRYYFSFITLLGSTFLDAAGALYAASLLMKLVFPMLSIMELSVIFAVVVAAYTIPGGLSAAIKVDLIQGILLLVGTFILTFLAMQNGGLDYLKNLLLEGDYMMKLIRPMDDPSVPWLGMIVGIPILGFYFWGNNQVLVQRVLTAKSIDHGRKGILLVGFLTVLLIFIIIFPAVIGKHLFPNLPKNDMVYPKLVIELMPTGLLGLMLAAMVAALTSTLSALLNSVATLFTMDFYTKFKKDSTQKEQVYVGKIVSIIVLILAVAWVPFVSKFDSLLKYYQEMLTYIAPPVVAVFFLGVFWKRINRHGAFWGLMGGAFAAIVTIVAKVGFDHELFGDIHFLLKVPFYFLFSAVIIIIVSLLSEPDDEEKIKDLIWTKKIYHEETQELIGVPFYKNFRVWSLVLIGFCFLVLYMYH
ncbi:SSS family solute:Na+ symporter [Flavobacterium sp. 7E]|uniref:sodium:solute symporter n=1 Tax=unclassified Flavobacterium TaxID=196869 RepID=UPI00156E9AC1|nr:MULTISPECIES: sodium:solute symporter [unclassified Flavobacterium]MBE0391017.1 Sodium/glucose cotransporter [Flavobacterium sp. PL002]NRS89272.1 SSS family solute:Na+ symporter [Flavobacterium sp. 7E]